MLTVVTNVSIKSPLAFRGQHPPHGFVGGEFTVVSLLSIAVPLALCAAGYVVAFVIDDSSGLLPLGAVLFPIVTVGPVISLLAGTGIGHPA